MPIATGPSIRIFIRWILLVLPCLVLEVRGQEYHVPEFRGEAMKYRLKYGVLNIGTAFISCTADPSGCGDRIEAEAHSEGVVNIFRRLDYRLECCMDVETGLPVHAVRSLRDRRNYLYNELEFDHHSRSDSTIIYSQLSGKRIVPSGIRDILTGFYHFRMNYFTDQIHPKEEVVIHTFYTDKLWDLRIRYAGEETITTREGSLDCRKYNPVTVVGKFFNHEDDITIWFTKDEVPVPVKIRLNLKIGAIHGELVDYHKPHHLGHSDSSNRSDLATH